MCEPLRMISLSLELPGSAWKQEGRKGEEEEAIQEALERINIHAASKKSSFDDLESRGGVKDRVKSDAHASEPAPPWKVFIMFVYHVCM